MAQRVLFTFEHVDSTEALNSRMARIIADGPYNGLLVNAIDVPSLYLNITAGDALTIEGVKIEESVDINNAVEIVPGHPTRRRIDLVCMYHKYVAGPTIPQGNAATYVVIKGDDPIDDITEPVVPYDKIDKYYLPLAEIHLPPGANFITQSMIHNIRRVANTKILEDIMAEALHYSLGNFAYYGWDVTQAGVTNLSISPGKGLLCGRVNTTTDDYILTGLRFAQFLKPPTDPDTGEFYQVGQNLTLLEQPDFPTKLAIEITTTGASVGGKIYVSGKNELGDQILDHEIIVNQGANETATYYSDAYFAEVYLEGIDAHELIAAGFDTFINIKDAPMNQIIVYGTPTGHAAFRIELNPAYKPKCNEMIIARVFTDADNIIQLDDLILNPLADWIDNLSPFCDSIRKEFYAVAIPVPDTHSLWMDGTRLFEDTSDDWSLTFGKGYKLNSRQIILGPNVPAPDINTVLRFVYKRLG